MRFSILLWFYILGFSTAAEIFCYYGSWSVYRNTEGRIQIEDIDPTLCTHIIYASIAIDANGKMVFMDNINEVKYGGFSKFIQLRQKNPDLKLLVSLGGWNEGSKKYSDVTRNVSLRNSLVKSIVTFLVKQGFDGLNIDWEYPGKRGGSVEDRNSFIQFLQDLRYALGKEMLLTVLVGMQSDLLSNVYDINKLNNVTDYIHLMAYEFHDVYSGFASHNSPLYSPNQTDTLSLNGILDSWIRAGVLPQKLVVGIAMYGRSFTLVSAKYNNANALTNGPGAAGPHTLQPGFLSYFEVCKMQLEGGWSYTWDESQKSPFMTKELSWIGYDNVNSVDLKTKFILNKNLAGVFIWSLDLDDGKNICGQGRFPLLQAIIEAINSKDETTSFPTCEPYAIIRDMDDCSIYYVCVEIRTGVYAFDRKTCSHGLYFDIKKRLCNIPSAVQC